MPGIGGEGDIGGHYMATLFHFRENQGAQNSDADQICPDVESAGGSNSYKHQDSVHLPYSSHFLRSPIPLGF